MSRKELYNAEYAQSAQVLTVHSPISTGTKTFCFCRQYKVLFWCEDSGPFPQDPQAASDMRAQLTERELISGARRAAHLL